MASTKNFPALLGQGGKNTSVPMGPVTARKNKLPPVRGQGAKNRSTPMPARKNNTVSPGNINVKMNNKKPNNNNFNTLNVNNIGKVINNASNAGKTNGNYSEKYRSLGPRVNKLNRNIQDVNRDLRNNDYNANAIKSKINAMKSESNSIGKEIKNVQTQFKKNVKAKSDDMAKVKAKNEQLKKIMANAGIPGFKRGFLGMIGSGVSFQNVAMKNMNDAIKDLEKKLDSMKDKKNRGELQARLNKLKGAKDKANKALKPKANNK